MNSKQILLLNDLSDHREQRFLLLRMQGVNNCDISGIHMLETIRQAYRERGGELFLMKVQKPVVAVMKSTGFYDQLGVDHFLEEEKAVSYLFYKVLDPAICIYECEARAFVECQNLPRRTLPQAVSSQPRASTDQIPEISPQELRQKLQNGAASLLVIDVREPREYQQGHIPQAKLNPLLQLYSNPEMLPPPNGQNVVLVCRSGRRSQGAAQMLLSRGYANITILRGGMLAWENAGLLETGGQLESGYPVGRHELFRQN